MTDTQKERAAVVDWLQNKVIAILDVLSAGETVSEAKRVIDKAGLLLDCVDAIERGEHLK